MLIYNVCFEIIKLHIVPVFPLQVEVMSFMDRRSWRGAWSQSPYSMKWSTEMEALSFRRRVITMSIQRFSSRRGANFTTLSRWILKSILGKVSTSRGPGHTPRNRAQNNPTATWAECSTFTKTMLCLWESATPRKSSEPNPLRTTLVHLWFKYHTDPHHYYKVKALTHHSQFYSVTGTTLYI